MADSSDIDTVRNMVALQCRSCSGAQFLAANVGIGEGALQKFANGHARLAPSAMVAMVRILFNGSRAWCPVTQRLLDVAPPADLAASRRVRDESGPKTSSCAVTT